MPAPGLRIQTPRDKLMALMERAARKHGLTALDLFTERRTDAHVQARLEVYEALTKPPWNWSPSRIAQRLGQDSTTVSHHLRAMRARQAEEQCRQAAAR